MLQIFIWRRRVDKWVYSSLPMGVPDRSRAPLSAHLMTAGPIAGQGRITANPSAFMRANTVRIYTVSADQTFHDNRRGCHHVRIGGGILAKVHGGPVAWGPAGCKIGPLGITTRNALAWRMAIRVPVANAATTVTRAEMTTTAPIYRTFKVQPLPRQRFQEELTALLGPILGHTQQRNKAPD
eukprot:gene12766-20289_t